MQVRRSRFMTGLAAVSLSALIALAAWNIFRPVDVIVFPDEPEHVPAAYVYITPSGSKFHRAECSSISKSKNTECIAREDAVERGYEACLTCEP